MSDVLHCWAIIWGNERGEPVAAYNEPLDGPIFATQEAAAAEVKRFRQEFDEKARAWVVEINAVPIEVP